MKSIIVPVATVLALISQVADAQLTSNTAVSTSTTTTVGSTSSDSFQLSLQASAKISASSRTGVFASRDFQSDSVSDDQLRFRSVSRSSGTKDSIEFFMNLNGFPRFKIREMAHSSDSTSIFAFRTGFLRLVEYNSTVDIRASTNALKFDGIQASQWTSLKTGTHSTTTSDGANVKVVISSLISPNAQFTGLNVTLQAMFTDSISIVNGTVLTPSGLKYSVYINNFPFQMQNSRLALVQAMWQRDSNVTAASTQSLTIGGGGAFVWDTAITADGSASQMSVLSAISADSNAMAGLNGGPTDNDGSDGDVGTSPKIIVFSFPKAASLMWDPYMAADGSASAPSSAVSVSVPIFSLLMTAALAFFA